MTLPPSAGAPTNSCFPNGRSWSRSCAASASSPAAAAARWSPATRCSPLLRWPPSQPCASPSAATPAAATSPARRAPGRRGRRSATRLRVLGATGEIDCHIGLVADHPTVVARRDPDHVARSNVELLTIVHLDVQPAGDAVAEVVYLAAVTADDRLYALRPTPARLEGGPHDCAAAQLHHVDLALVDLTRLIGPVKRLPFGICHRRSSLEPAGAAGPYRQRGSLPSGIRISFVQRSFVSYEALLDRAA